MIRGFDAWLGRLEQKINGSLLNRVLFAAILVILVFAIIHSIVCGFNATAKEGGLPYWMYSSNKATLLGCPRGFLSVFEPIFLLGYVGIAAALTWFAYWLHKFETYWETKYPGELTPTDERSDAEQKGVVFAAVFNPHPEDAEFTRYANILRITYAVAVILVYWLYFTYVYAPWY